MNLNLNFKQTGMSRLVPGKAFTEIILGYAFLITVNFFLLNQNMGFAGVHPHPYWAVILLLAARYGYRSGLWAGLIGAFFNLVLIHGRQLLIDGPTVLEMTSFVEPLLFIIVGAVIGEIREIQKRANEELREDFAKVKKEYDTLKIHYTALSEAKQELDGNIISTKDTLSTLNEAAQDLRSLNEQDIYPAVLGLLKNYAGAQAASIYLLDNNRLILKEALEEQSSQRPTAFNADYGMMGLAIKAGKLVSIKAAMTGEENKDYLQSGILASVPIMDEAGKNYGVINIEKIPFVKFNPLTLRMIALIADWCGAALENAAIYQTAKDKDITDEITGAHKNSYLGKRLNEEFQRARRYKLPLSVIMIDFIDIERLPQEKQDDIMTVASGVIHKMARTIDLLFHAETPGRYVLLLPSTDLSGARVLNGKLQKELDAFKFRGEKVDQLEIRTGISSYQETLTMPFQLLQEAVNRLNERH